MSTYKKLPNGDLVYATEANPMDDRSKDGQPFTSREEMMTAMRSEQYTKRKDEAYIARVQDRLAVTDFTEVSGALINEPLPMGNGSSEVDQVAAHMPEGFRSVADFMKLFKSDEYKTNPAFRLAVEGAVAAASPNWEPRTTDEAYRVTFDGSDGSGRGGNDPNNAPAEA